MKCSGYYREFFVQRSKGEKPVYEHFLGTPGGIRYMHREVGRYIDR